MVYTSYFHTSNIALVQQQKFWYKKKRQADLRDHSGDSLFAAIGDKLDGAWSLIL
ncbi:hypothetical protein ACU8KH_01034 [Lachancea thermotolerans]